MPMPALAPCLARYFGGNDVVATACIDALVQLDFKERCAPDGSRVDSPIPIGACMDSAPPVGPGAHYLSCVATFIRDMIAFARCPGDCLARPGAWNRCGCGASQTTLPARFACMVR
jgi:hypothetical protein